MKRMKRWATALLCVVLACSLSLPAMAGVGFYNETTGTFTNHENATFNNNGTFYNYGLLNVGGLFNNYSKLTGIGTLRGVANGVFSNFEGSYAESGAVIGSSISGISIVDSSNIKWSDYADRRNISYMEAVAVVSTIGLMSADAYRNFNPHAVMTRTAGAQLIARMLLGNKVADALIGTGSKFADVSADYWAAGYIEFLAYSGVVFADEDGKFRPGDALTATEFARMLLCALGYDAEREGLNNGNWQTNTMNLVSQTGLFSGTSGVTATGSRE